MKILFCLLFCASVCADSFRVGLANIYFMDRIFRSDIEEANFKPLKEPVTKEIEGEFDSMNRQYLARYINYLAADVLVICEAPPEKETLENFVREYLDDRYVVLHNSAVVVDKRYYFEHQLAVLVDKDKFVIRRYEELEEGKATEENQFYPYPSFTQAEFQGEVKNFYWSRFPIEFDLALKSDLTHWYKFIATYPKSKYSSKPELNLKARMQNYMQQKMVRDRLEEVFEQFEDIFVLGDMNDSVGLDEYEQQLGFDGLGALYKGDADDILWDPVLYRKGEGTYIYRDEASVIDYIFVSHGLKKGRGVVRTRVNNHFHFYQTMVRDFKYTRSDRLSTRELFLSDHAPVTVDVKH
jgi:hypothetical protein